ncbi:hypothetical protein SRABI96_04616 [Peribacillus sp. Bi96]|nr:hypothetical protein SRABI96_04616 [Peribacillus sp. Bi96]
MSSVTGIKVGDGKTGKALPASYIPNRVEPRLKRLCLYGQRRFFICFKALKGVLEKDRA